MVDFCQPVPYSLALEHRNFSVLLLENGFPLRSAHEKNAQEVWISKHVFPVAFFALPCTFFKKLFQDEFTKIYISIVQTSGVCKCCCMLRYSEFRNLRGETNT